MPVDNRQVAVYIRWSTDDQGEGTTLDVQRDRCLHYAMSQGWETIPPDRIFIDEGYSGGNLNRPGITKIRQLVRQRKLSVVVVFKIDRLSRNIVDAVDLVLREWDGVCQLACVTEPVDTASDMGRMFFGILAMFADFERSAIKSRTFSGKVRRAQEGRNPGIGLPYGYTNGATPGSVEIVETQAVVVKRIFAMYQSGMGGSTIAQTLNREGVPSARGTVWSNTTVVKVVSNPAYTGKFIYGRRQRNPRLGKDEGAKQYIRRDEPLAVTDMFPPLIDEVTFLRCQGSREARVLNKSGRTLASQYLLTGLAKCRCRQALCGHTTTDRYGKPRQYYRCIGKGTKGDTSCDSGGISVEELDAAVVHEVMELLSPENKQRLIEGASRRTAETMAVLEVRLADADAELANFDTREARAKRDYLAGKLPPELYAELRDEIKTDRQRSTNTRISLRAELDQVRAAADDHREMERRLAQIETWDSLSTPERKQLLAGLVSEVVAYRPKRSKDGWKLSVQIKGF